MPPVGAADTPVTQVAGLRARLIQRARAGRVEDAERIAAALERQGIASDDDHACVLLAYTEAGRALEAEAYLRHRLAAGGEACAGHFAIVLHGFAAACRPDDALRLYREVEARGLEVDDEHRVGVLLALGMAHRHHEARRWYERFAAEGFSLAVHAALVEAHGCREALPELRRLRHGAPSTLRREPPVALAFAHAFAAAGDPDAALAFLPDALTGLTDEPDDRDALLLACLLAQQRHGSPEGLARLAALAEGAGADLGSLAGDAR